MRRLIIYDVEATRELDPTEAECVNYGRRHATLRRRVVAPSAALAEAWFRTVYPDFDWLVGVTCAGVVDAVIAVTET